MHPSIFQVFKFLFSSEIFYCNFDQSTSNTAQCGGSLHQLVSGTAPAFLVSNFDNIQYGAETSYLTDIKSITGFTAKNSTCNIPFNYNGIDYHYCVLFSASTYKCEVGDKGAGVLDDCVRGNFLRYKAGVVGGAYSASFSFTKPISVIEFGTYILSFYTFVNCPKASCNTVGDSISIKIKKGQNGIFEEVYRNGTDDGRAQEVKWKRDEIPVQLSSSEVFLRIDFSRRTALSLVQGALYIDEISLTKVNDESTDTITPSTSITTTEKAELTTDEIPTANLNSTTNETTLITSPEAIITEAITTSTSTIAPTKTTEIATTPEVLTTTPVAKSTSTTTSTTSTKTTTTSTTFTTTTFQTAKPVFYCNFDQSNIITTQCGGSLHQLISGSAPSYGVSNQNAITIGVQSSYLTDIKSITGPIAKNFTCNIPFTYATTVNYFCYGQSSNFFFCEVGEIGSGQTDSCVRGNYLRYQAGTLGYPYSAAFSFTNPIAISEYGAYILSFYTFVNCPRPGCDNVGDTISIQIKNGQSGIFEEVFKSGTDDGRAQEVKWRRDDIPVQLTSSEVFLRIEFSRQILLLSVPGGLFIDEISLAKVHESPKTITELINITIPYTTASLTEKLTTEPLTTSTTRVFTTEPTLYTASDTITIEETNSKTTTKPSDFNTSESTLNPSNVTLTYPITSINTNLTETSSSKISTSTIYEESQSTRISDLSTLAAQSTTQAISTSTTSKNSYSSTNEPVTNEAITSKTSHTAINTTTTVTSTKELITTTSESNAISTLTTAKPLISNITHYSNISMNTSTGAITTSKHHFTETTTITETKVPSTSSLNSTRISTTTTITTNTAYSETTFAASTKPSLSIITSTIPPTDATITSIIDNQSTKNELVTDEPLTSDSSAKTTTIKPTTSTRITTSTKTNPTISSRTSTQTTTYVSQKPKSLVGPIVGGTVGGVVAFLVIAYFIIKKNKGIKVIPDEKQKSGQQDTSV